jgi:hypothetical protein
MVNAGDLFCGARLLPGASRPLLGIAPGKLRDRVLPLEELAPELACRMSRELAPVETAKRCFAIMERHLAGLAQGAKAIDPIISSAAAMLLRARGNATGEIRYGPENRGACPTLPAFRAITARPGPPRRPPLSRRRA